MVPDGDGSLNRQEMCSARGVAYRRLPTSWPPGSVESLFHTSSWWRTGFWRQNHKFESGTIGCNIVWNCRGVRFVARSTICCQEYDLLPGDCDCYGLPESKTGRISLYSSAAIILSTLRVELAAPLATLNHVPPLAWRPHKGLIESARRKHSCLKMANLSNLSVDQTEPQRESMQTAVCVSRGVIVKILGWQNSTAHR